MRSPASSTAGGMVGEELKGRPLPMLCARTLGACVMPPAAHQVVKPAATRHHRAVRDRTAMRPSARSEADGEVDPAGHGDGRSRGLHRDGDDGRQADDDEQDPL